MSARAQPLPPPWLNRALTHPLVRVAVPLAIAAAAFAVLRELAAHVAWADVRADVAAASPTQIGLAICFTALSFLGIAGYDVISVLASAKGRVPVRVAAMAGACGCAVSNLLGFSYLTGTAVRYRIYSAFGLDAADVAAIFATSWVAFWLGLTILLAGLLTLHPAGLSVMIGIAASVQVVLGLALLAGLALLWLWLAAEQRHVVFGGKRHALPSPVLAGLLTGSAVIDMLGAALALFVLMPADLGASFPWFFVVYVAAIALGVMSHAPGGLGVFEASIIAGLGAGGRSDVLAGLLVYRLVYTGLPFVVAATALAAIWLFRRRGAAAANAGWAFRLVRPLVPPVAAAIALVSGTILLVSGNLPAEGSRLGLVSDILPLGFIEVSHLAGSVVGMLLIVVARGLYRRLYRAWLIAMVLFALGIVASLSKGLDWEEALALTLGAGILGVFRSAFYRVSGASALRLSGPWLVSILGLFAAVVWMGLFAYSHVAYRDALWWDFALHGDASRFLRASLAAAAVLAVVTFNSLVMARGPRMAAGPIPDAVRRLVAESADTDANIALMGDKAFLIAPDEGAFLAYADTGRTLIAKGDPVGAEAAGRALIWQFREKADAMGRSCAFYAVSPAYLATYLDMGLHVLKFGEVARVDLRGFGLDGSRRKDLRHARSKAQREGVVFRILPRDRLGQYLEDLRAVSDAWLAMKQGSEKGFALGAFEDGYVANFDFAVLQRGKGGEILAFANLFQGAGRHELSLDMMRYRPGAPGYVMDALFAELMLWGAGRGFHWFSLGAAPFAGLETHRLAPLSARLGGFLYAHGEQIYHFEGLRAFKQKFDPVWSPNYIATPGGLAVPRILYEVNVLISGGMRGLMR
jgi:phosphatidylglycerol lysyltransferase